MDIMTGKPKLQIVIPQNKKIISPLTPLSDPKFSSISPLDKIHASMVGIQITENIEGIDIYVKTLTIPKMVMSREQKNRSHESFGVYTVFIRNGFVGRIRVLLVGPETVIREEYVNNYHDDMRNISGLPDIHHGVPYVPMQTFMRSSSDTSLQKTSPRFRSVRLFE